MASQDNIVAHPGGGQTFATAITGSPARVTQASPGDSVVLPASTSGTQVVLINDTDSSIQVWPNASEKLDTLTAMTPVILRGRATALYTCVSVGKWHTHAGA